MHLSRIMPYVRYCVIRNCPLNNNWEIPKRTISDHELVYIFNGSGKINISGTDYEAMPSQLYYFHPELPHSLWSNPVKPLSFYAIHFSFTEVSFEDGIWKIIDDKDSLMPFNNVNNINKSKLIEGQFLKTIDYWSSKSAFNNSAVNGSFLELLQFIVDDINSSNFNYSNKAKIDIILTYINSNFEKQIRIEDLSAMVKLSEDYLGVIFKKHSGYSINKYINKCRIDRAKEIIFEQNPKISEVAQTLGFKDEFYFSKVFKKFEGISPSEFNRRTHP